MPTYDWLTEVVKALEPWTPATCRVCGEMISSRVVALHYATRETDPEAPEPVRWYCSAACQATGEAKPPS